MVLPPLLTTIPNNLGLLISTFSSEIVGSLIELAWVLIPQVWATPRIAAFLSGTLSMAPPLGLVFVVLGSLISDSISWMRNEGMLTTGCKMPGIFLEGIFGPRHFVPLDERDQGTAVVVTCHRVGSGRRQLREDSPVFEMNLEAAVISWAVYLLACLLPVYWTAVSLFLRLVF